MGEESSDYRKWEEDIYWTHFKSPQFFQLLSGPFDQQLAIPKKFANNLSDKLAQTIALKGPSGTTWNVGLTTSGDDLLLKHGWKDFVVDHSLEEDDVLIFKYNGDARFDVLMFDRRSLCEKEASYFVRKCGNVEPELRCQTKKKTVEISEVMKDLSHDVGCTPSNKLRNDCTSMPSVGQYLKANRKIRKGANNGKQGLSRKSGSNFVKFASNRRLVTEAEKEKALQLAKAASTKDSFIVVMRPSHVYKGFFMSIPAQWAANHLRRKSQNMVLRVGEKTWNVSFSSRVRGVGGLLGGWKKFAVENFLEEFDVCLFELASGTIGPLLLDVKIFRVVEEVIPPTRLSLSSSKG